MDYLPPPWKIKMVEKVNLLSRSGRESAVKEAGFNTFLLKSRDVFIDLLTDSGTSAMSDNQWAGLMLGDEAYAGSENFYNLEKAVKDVYGFSFVVPTHQGRAAEHLMARALVQKGQHVLSNMYFTTSREHVERRGGIWQDCIVPEAHDPQKDKPFKGNFDIARTGRLIKKLGKNKIAFIRVEANCNMAGGQPVSMKNLEDLKTLAERHEIPVIMDATRALENAYFIKAREKGWEKTPVKKILKNMMRFTDGITVSSKKDNLVNIGGFLATRNKKIFEETKTLVVVYEGLHTYGGMSGRDMEALARGIREMVENDDYVEHRVKQVEWFGGLLKEAGVPIVVPVGGHAVYLDAKKFLSHLPQSQYPAQTLSASIYEECAVRSMERGIVSAGRDPKTRKEHGSKLELVRLTVPRRVYTNDHLGFAAEGIVNLFKKRQTIRGLKMTYEPKQLRFFQAKFRRV
ncbi:MAG: tyrosine phenol-lyase [Candidatus Niyogibacteria bacterium RIFCSPLOWO2_01_FULL_45_48]|uniref:Tyrosine phenol-lyase n=1 Tax=Candidatus Niyogibacteria bacterium RIFCSPLOWO2_01_FULL_45_48 TaxID=1801724 RepID=A0A1G2EYW2_9BACT|nr:MAG: tyrosine phenol-lyase [Candidatus Niyogibacteria bacterium RIFCSPLOWO2_01_FULL_45_48]